MDMTQLVLIGTLTVITFWRKDIILYLILAPLLVGMGLSWYDSYKTPLGMLTSIGIGLTGAYCFALGVFNMLKGNNE
jgi:hypothetical protein